MTVTVETRKLQNMQHMILKDVHDVCVENGLKYFLIGGTLIGAIRHQGFIPWDDDVDIAMYREDLYKLEKIMQNNHSEKYFIQNFNTDSNYTRYITKIRLNNTQQVERGFEDIDTHKGIFIDIFPLDKVHKESGLGLYLRGKALRLLFAYKTTRIVNAKNPNNIKNIMRLILRPLVRILPDKKMNQLFDYVCTMSKKKKCDYTTSFASHYQWKKQLVKNEVYGNGELKKFEEGYFYTPDQYDFLLRQIFGDYMQLPPLSKRNSGHDVVFVDFGPYKDSND